MSVSGEQVRDHLRGVAVGLLTPFDDDLQIEHENIRDNAQTLYQAGARTFLAAANISEYHSLSKTERIDVVETSVSALPADACVLAGVGGATTEARELIESYDDIGVNAMMIMPPDHTYLHEQGLLEYYRKLSAITDTPLVPYVRGFDPSIEYLGELTRVDGVVGIKYALEDPSTLGAGIDAGDDETVWVNGLAEPYAVAFWAEGADGFSAGVSNFRPEVGLELFDALSTEDWDRARTLRNICLPYQKFRGESGHDNDLLGALSVPAVKKGLQLAGLNGGRVREPLVPLTAEEENRAETLYEQLDDDISRTID